MKNFRIPAILLSVAVASACTTILARGNVSRGFETEARENKTGITLVVDSIDCRSDLTRIYGSIKGQPNTAQRIDSLSLVAPAVKIMQVDDIDGIDMRRWFQWDETGVIQLEIDFAALKKLPSTMVMRAVTPKGPVVWTITPHAVRKK